MHRLKKINKKSDVAVLLGFYKGENYILEQIKSIQSQKANVKIWISDDGDSRTLMSLLKSSFPEKFLKNICILEGPKAGFAKNFQFLIGNSDIKADFYAFADQDDIWGDDKLSRALGWLSSISADRPALYCSRTLLIDSSGNKVGFSPLFNKNPSFKNAIVQSIAGGNTMVMNKAARDLLAATKTADIVSHDWWAYILITGAGGEVFYDPFPSTHYRQHHGNLVGGNNSLYSKALRASMMFRGVLQGWININCKALNEHRHLLTPTNREALDMFCKARQECFAKRVVSVWKLGVHRQTLCGSIGLMIAAMLKKI